MARRHASGGTPATVALERAGVAFTVHAYDHDPAAPSYGLEAAEQLGLDPAAVFKTLLAEVDGRLVVAVVPVSGQLDLKALAAAVGGKRAVMVRRRGHLPARSAPTAPDGPRRLSDGAADDLRQRRQARARPRRGPWRPGQAPRRRRAAGRAAPGREALSSAGTRRGQSNQARMPSVASSSRPPKNRSSTST
jgi:hypothetical protein